MDDSQSHLGLLNLVEGVGKCTHRTLHITLDDDVQLLEPTLRNTGKQVLKRHWSAVCQILRTQPLAAGCCNLARKPLVLNHAELLTRSGDAVETENLYRYGRPGRDHRLTLVVEHRPHAAEGLAHHEDVADTHRAALHQQGAHGATA